MGGEKRWKWETQGSQLFGWISWSDGRRGEEREDGSKARPLPLYRRLARQEETFLCAGWRHQDNDGIPWLTTPPRFTWWGATFRTNVIVPCVLEKPCVLASQTRNICPVERNMLKRDESGSGSVRLWCRECVFHHVFKDISNFLVCPTATYTKQTSHISYKSKQYIGVEWWTHCSQHCWQISRHCLCFCSVLMPLGLSLLVFD